MPIPLRSFRGTQPSSAAFALLLTRTDIHSHLSGFDLTVVVVYLLGITAFGLRFRTSRAGGQSAGTFADRSLRSYFLADNTIPWWAIALSIVSAETSTLTIISVPGVAFAGNFGFLQVVLGYMLGRVVVAALLLPRYFAGEMLTAYQLIERRFGGLLHKLTAGLFLLTRAAAEGVRVFAVSIVVGIAIGTRDVLSIGIITALTLLYTFEGGMAAVIWTDVVQMAIYVGGTLVAIATLGSHVNGGWAQIHAVAGNAGKFHMLDFAMNLTSTYTFWAGVLGGTFLTMASHGTDQLMVQRMLAARNLRESRVALLSSGAVIFVQFALFLLIGAGLFVFYGQHPAALATLGAGHLSPAPLSPDRIFPSFIVREMPAGIAGLLVAAILAAAMSNLSAALNSLSSTTVVDFYMTLRPAADGRERAVVSKSSTVVWALVLFLIAIYSLRAGGKGHVVEIGLSIASVAYGCLLGVFLLGTLTRFATQTGAAVGMVFGFVLNLWLWQGVFPVHLGPLSIPHIAWTWYVLIGAAATFAVGSLASVCFRRQSPQATVAVLAALLGLALTARLYAAEPHSTTESAHPFFHAIQATPATQERSNVNPGNVKPDGNFDFSAVSSAINDAIAAGHLPGAVALVGHSGQVVFKQAYGVRELAHEPGLDGQPLAQPEPMTEETIFDMASLTKVLATAPAVMQMYEAGKLGLDDPLEKYLPAFNPAHDTQRARVTVRMLLTHTSGEAPDIDMKDAWGLAAPDPAEGIRRALTTPLQSAPGEVFRYSDINFILLGHLVETLSGEPLDVYAEQHIFAPLGMTHTRFLPLAKVCGPHKVYGAAIGWTPTRPGRIAYACPPGSWSTALLAGIAPTAHDDESKDHPELNPDFGRLLHGAVDDPSTRRMGGVAGHAGVFSPAYDVSLYAQALLDRLLHDKGSFPLRQATLRIMTAAQQPASVQAATILSRDPSLPAPTLKTVQGTPVRGFGWDINTAYSRPRGALFPTEAPSQPSSATPSFGHTGYTGTSLWIDPGSETFVVLLSNAVHSPGNTPISALRGQVATAAAQGLHLYGSPAPVSTGSAAVCSPDALRASMQPVKPGTPQANPGTLQDVQQQERSPVPRRPFLHETALVLPSGKAQNSASSASSAATMTLTGIDVLEATHFGALRTLAERHAGPLRLGLLTNQTGLDSAGRRTIDVLVEGLAQQAPNARLTTLFSPEHGLYGKHDDTHIANDVDSATGLPVISLYGPAAADKRPRAQDLSQLDAVLIDLQDAGVRFYTYETVVGYFLEAAAQNHIELILLDRPNPLGGLAVQGPVSDAGQESYTDYMPIPVRHGMTLGELAQFFNANARASNANDAASASAQSASGNSAGGLHARLTVIPMQRWRRGDYFDDTGLRWTNPSPNLRNLTAATLYPGLGLLDYTNISVGRGSATPFELFGAGVASAPSNASAQKEKVPAPSAWFHAGDVVAALNARHIPGVMFAATATSIADDANHYPYHGQTIEAVRIDLVDRGLLDSPELGIEILAVLHRLYPEQFELGKTARLIANRVTSDTLSGDHAKNRDTAVSLADPRAIARGWQVDLDRFKNLRQAYLIYP